jgi:hypothetical protein
MILKIVQYRTPSGKSKVRGRNDSIELVPETMEEAEKLEARRRAGFPVFHRGSGYWSRAIEDLRGVAESIDPHYREVNNQVTA